MNFVTDLGAFPFEIYISVCDTDQQFLKGLRKILEPHEWQEVSESEYMGMQSLNGRTSQFLSGALILRTVDDPSTPIGAGVIAHEVFHAVHYVMDSVGIPFSDDTNEVYAYHIQFLMEKILSRWLQVSK